MDPIRYEGSRNGDHVTKQRSSRNAIRIAEGGTDILERKYPVEKLARIDITRTGGCLIESRGQQP